MTAIELGARISARRKLLGLDQRDLAEIAGVSVHALSNIETGKANPTLKVINRLLESLGLDLQVVIRTMEVTDA